MTSVHDALPAPSSDRRGRVFAGTQNGLDSVEVADNRRQLTLMFFESVPDGIGPGNIWIEGPAGQPVPTVTNVRREANSDPQLRDHLVANLSCAGGAGPYHVGMVESRPNGRPGTAPLRGFDPRFTSCQIRFNIDEPLAGSARRPEAESKVSAAPASAPTYLARDYQGLRQVLLDRLRQTVPGLTVQHVPDLMVTLIELFAYLGDELSYFQDAVATEAYLQTARRRTSLRRHARLVGYPFHEGCHARAWLDLQVNQDHELPLRSVTFGALADGQTVTFTPLRAALPATFATGEIPESERERGPKVPLRVAHNLIQIWSWGEHTSFVFEGATEATLAEPLRESPTDPERSLQLQPGDVLMFEELLDSDGQPPDETHRHVVRLTSVERIRDPLFDRALLSVKWDSLDALPFSLPVNDVPPVASLRGEARSVARANLVLVGEGRRVDREEIPVRRTSRTGSRELLALAEADLTYSCPYPDLDRVAAHQATVLADLYQRWRTRIRRWLRYAERGEPLNKERRAELLRQLGDETARELGLVEEPEGDPNDRANADVIGLAMLLARADGLLESRRRRLDVLSRLAAASGPLSGPLLAEVHRYWGRDLTHGLDTHHPAAWGPAVDAVTQDPTHAQPLLEIAERVRGQVDPRWQVTTELVDVEPKARRLTVEMDNDRTATLRLNPAIKQHGDFVARYMVSIGSAGNVAAEAITQVLAGPREIIRSVRNPLPATGGTDPESMADARRAIPGHQMTKQQRALTPSDYVAIAEALPGVRRAAATQRWSGNRLHVRLAVQPVPGAEPGSALLRRIEHAVVVARRISHDVDLTAPDYHPVAVNVKVTLDAFATRDVARHQIAELLSNGQLNSGEPAFFHPSQFGFGDSLYKSALVAAVQNLAVVESVTVTEMRFLSPRLAPPRDRPQRVSVPPPVPSLLDVSPTGIIRCDNDVASPQNGHVGVDLVGGR